MNIQNKNRIYKFDNIKLLTIILVVVGHVIEPYIGKSELFKSLFIFIYSFHMPLFIFISGLFQNRFNDYNKLKINKIAFYVTLGFLLKIMHALTKVARGMDFTFSFFGGSSIDWYLFVLSMFMVTAYLTRKVHPAIVLSVSFVLGCFSGYVDIFNDTLWLSRYFVFMPIYFSGYYMTPQLLIKIEKHFVTKLISGASMLLYFVLCFRNLDLVYKLRMLFTGKNSFATVSKYFIEDCSVEHRLLCYGISALLCMAVFCYIPNIKVPILSKMGANTLSVYFWHVPVLNLIKLTPFFTMVFSLGDPMYKIILLTFAVIITLVLSLNVFMFPLKALSKLLDKLKPCWCYVVIAAPFVAGAVLHYNEITDKISQLYYRITK
ncbi:MAG: acyltransferase family protein [Eubacteriales bacterium]|nr:acyltransferase family protein [Eubacteriales bacterium]